MATGLSIVLLLKRSTAACFQVEILFLPTSCVTSVLGYNSYELRPSGESLLSHYATGFVLGVVTEAICRNIKVKRKKNKHHKNVLLTQGMRSRAASVISLSLHPDDEQTGNSFKS